MSKILRRTGESTPFIQRRHLLLFAFAQFIFPWPYLTLNRLSILTSYDRFAGHSVSENDPLRSNKKKNLLPVPSRMKIAFLE